MQHVCYAFLIRKSEHSQKMYQNSSRQREVFKMASEEHTLATCKTCSKSNKKVTFCRFILGAKQLFEFHEVDHFTQAVTVVKLKVRMKKCLSAI